PSVAGEALVRDAYAVAAVDHLHGEGFVQLPQIDVGSLLPGLLEELRHREPRADAHLARIAAGDGEAAEDAQGTQPSVGPLAIAHHHGGTRAIGELARIAGGDAAALDRRLDLRHALVGRIRADALVLGGDGLAHRLVARVLVDHLLLHRDRRDLVLELAV